MNTEEPQQEDKPPSLLLRLGGSVGGAIFGVVVSALLFVFISPMLRLVEPSVSSLCSFVIAGGTIGIILGIIFPKRMLELGWVALCNCIPGI